MSEGHVGLTGIRKAFKSLGDDVTLTRFVKDKSVVKRERKPKQLTDLKRRLLEVGQSIFHRTVKSAKDVPNVLVSGHSNVKIGRDVRKGHLRGYWIYTLSLEERATCPRSCEHWGDCYGNNMPYSNRVKHDEDLMPAIERDIIKLLAVRGRKGLLIRLHALGDFYSERYVWFWNDMLAKYPNISIYGYTARKPYTTIGQAIGVVKLLYPKRFAVRWSDGRLERDCTVSIHHEADAPTNALVCPEQTGRTAACATCGVCWGTDRNVAFIAH